MKKIPEYLLMVYSLSGTLSIAVSQAAMGLGILIAAFDRRRSTYFELRPVGLEYPLLAWVIASLAATAFAPDAVASAEKLKKLILWGVLLWPSAVLWRRWSVGRLYMGLLFAAGASSLYGVLTFLLQDGAELGVRIRGFHGFYLTNAGLLLLCTFPALLLATCPRISASYRWGAGIAAFAMLASQFFGALPGAWIGTVTGLIWVSIVRRYVIGGAALLVAAVAVALAPPFLREVASDLLNPASPGNLDRIELWRNGWELFSQRPFTGWGLNDLRDAYALVKAPGEPTRGHMHSVPVHVAVTMGVLGLAAWAWLVGSFFRVLASARRQANGYLRHVVDGAEASLVAFLFAGLVEWNLGDSELIALLCFLIGTAIAAGRLSRLKEDEVPQPPGRAEAAS